ncbi:hypothetical protein H8S37_15430 [Mediterraneibacter sp. NSJ-55]|uniref:Uncharacterized protein n=1 Tax=Mediterraneibacter hominis TaxID=2763054 RepID=A0A923LK27_9FIRM|nr:DUF6070 family protein [Mediterraneibacter hominis]MBC5690307.1 hypothetical protein [Mediterraneibacter hominis]
MKLKRRSIVFLSIILLCFFTGCAPAKKGDMEGAEVEKDSNVLKESERLAEKYRDVYEEAEQMETLGTEETQKNILSVLGAEGYCAVDSENQINMTNEKSAEQFCEKASKGEKAEIPLLIVADNGGFVRYDLSCEEGKMEVDRSNLTWNEEGNPCAEQVDSYTAKEWKYTEKGYLFLELERPAGFDGPSGHTAIRIKPLDENLRQWTKKCLLPVGYAGNNLFITDWSSENRGQLCLYDLFEPFYKMKNGEEKIFDAKVGTKEYAIPEGEFESVIQTFLPVDTEILRMEEGYDIENGCYRYRQRGQYDIGGNPDTPYPEVVECKENDDGTVTLTVDAVWKKKNTDRAFTHKVQICPRADGTFLYLSNQIEPSGENQIPDYVPRLSDEEWEQYYQK